MAELHRTDILVDRSEAAALVLAGGVVVANGAPPLEPEIVAREASCLVRRESRNLR